MKRLLIVLALICATGCLQQCQAVGHGAIGGGALGEGVLGGGAVGGRPSAGGCSLPGTVHVLYDPDSLAGDDTDPVSAWTDSGAAGANLTQGTGTKQPTLQKPCEGGGILNEAPCIDLDGGDYLDSGSFAELSHPYVGFWVADHDSPFTSQRVTVGTVSGGRHTGQAYLGRHHTFASTGGLGDTGTGITSAKFDAVVVDWGTASAATTINGVAGSTIDTRTTAGHTTFRVGCQPTGAACINGRIVTAGLVSGATHAQVYEYLTCKYGSFPQ